MRSEGGHRQVTAGLGHKPSLPTFPDHILREEPRERVNTAEALLGREQWTAADYRRAGEEETDQRWPDMTPGERKQFVDCYVMLNCPAEKRRAAIAASNAEFDTGRPDWARPSASNRKDLHL